MEPATVARYFFRSVLVLVLLNLLVKPAWIFGVDRQVQVLAGYEAYGRYFSYFSFTTIFNILADAGITLYVQQRVAGRLQSQARWLPQIVRYKLLLSLGYAVVCGALGFLLGLTDAGLLLPLLLLQVLLSWIAFVRAVLAARQQFIKSSLLSVLDKLLLVIPAGFYLYTASAPALSMYAFAWWQVGAAALALAAGALLLHFYKVTAADSATRLPTLQEIMGDSLPFAAVVLAMFVHSRADAVLLNLLPGPAEQAGQYAAMYRFVDAATVLSYLAAGFLLSFWSRHLSNRALIADTVNKMFRMLMAGALLAGVLFFFYSVPLQQWLYQRPETQSAAVLQWGMLLLMPAFLIDIFGTLLTANRQLKTYLYITLLCVVLNILGNVVLIPRLHALGATLTALGTQTIMAACLLHVCYRRWRLVPNAASVRRVALLAALLVLLALLLRHTTLGVLPQIAILVGGWMAATFALQLIAPGWFIRWQRQTQ